MAVIQNKWTVKERKKKSYESSPKKSPEGNEDSNVVSPPHLTVSRATRSRTLRGVRK